jgi:hypothetical protein
MGVPQYSQSQMQTDYFANEQAYSFLRLSQESGNYGVGSRNGVNSTLRDNGPFQLKAHQFFLRPEFARDSPLRHAPNLNAASPS